MRSASYTMIRVSCLWVRGFTRRYCAFASCPRQSGETLLPLQHQPDRICILRLSALGDATHVVPVVRSIQDHWPESKISWIIGKLEHRLLADLDGVEFIEFDKRAGWAAINQ